MNPQLIISPHDGSIRIQRNESCIVIDKTLTAERAVAELSPFYLSELDHGNGYVWNSYSGININGTPGSFALCFYAGRLMEVHLGLSNPNEATRNGWPSQASVERDVALLRNALMQQLSRSFERGTETFPWGSAWAVFDAKAFLPSAGVRYRLPETSL
ncbi:hypothetical protein JFV30_16235 [Pseudomonas sp. TH32]|uniref:hypothetical protein n=1 Tax=Pseudomonas sp. TH32 TaxID=2796397 RepID=UPI001912B9F3|nr:hypothetical protein [Pseudomonas sp. TH32]MBK5438307.1 hypothetical protein [Pseudomonas sp. TH32]